MDQEDDHKIHSPSRNCNSELRNISPALADFYYRNHDVHHAATVGQNFQGMLLMDNHHDGFRLLLGEHNDGSHDI